MSSADLAPELPNGCRNCGECWGAQAPRFCPQCGQETVLRPPTVGEFVQQFGGAFVSTEGALWRTLRLLLARPGELTRQYLAGRRKYYVLPLRLYLTVSVVTLLLMRLLAQADLQPGVQVDAGAEMPKNVALELGVGRAGLREGRFFCEQLPAWVCGRLQRRLDIEPSQITREARQLGERFVGNLGGAMFLLLPAFALFLKLAYLNRPLRYTEHLVFALHLHAFWFVAIALMLLGQGWLTGLAALSMPVYAALAARRVYADRWWTLVLRGALLTLAYLVTLALAIALIGVWSLLS